MRFRAQFSIAYLINQVAIVRDDADGVRALRFDSWELIPEGTMAPSYCLLELDRRVWPGFAQSMMDDLWGMGVRPTKFSASDLDKEFFKSMLSSIAKAQIEEVPE